MGLFRYLQFIDPSEPVFWQFVLLGSTFAACSFIALLFYALLAVRLTGYLKSVSVMKWFNRITGGVFVGFGTSLLANR